MADNRRGKERRFYFSRGQLVLLGASFVAAALIIFVMGMFVGKGIEGRKLAKPEEPLIRVPVTPSNQDSGTAASPGKEELTFYDTLTRPPVIVAAAENGEKVVAETKKPAQQAELRKKQGPAPPTAEKSANKVEPAKKPKPAEVESGEASKPWTVQVNAFPDPRSAQMWVDKLKSKGYNAYSAEVVNKGKTWYRVRVGQFVSRDEAERLEQALRTKENFPKAFVTSR